MMHPSCQDRRIHICSLNLAQAHLTLAIPASSTPPPNCVAQIAEFRKTFQLQIGLNLHTACFAVLLAYFLTQSKLPSAKLIGHDFPPSKPHTDAHQNSQPDPGCLFT